MIRTIIVQFQIAGLHQWQQCDIKEVSYLRDLHRHTFYFTCKKVVSHNERDIEIIQFKNRIIKYINDKYKMESGECLFGNLSCESLAEELIAEFHLCSCKVLEDNENGAEILI